MIILRQRIYAKTVEFVKRGRKLIPILPGGTVKKGGMVLANNETSKILEQLKDGRIPEVADIQKIRAATRVHNPGTYHAKLQRAVQEHNGLTQAERQIMINHRITAGSPMSPSDKRLIREAYRGWGGKGRVSNSKSVASGFEELVQR